MFSEGFSSGGIESNQMKEIIERWEKILPVFTRLSLDRDHHFLS